MQQYSYRSPKRRRVIAEINVVPYIDVMLVLLIIFMVTAPLVTQGVKVDLPQAAAETLAEDSKPPMIASIDKQGRYYLSVGESIESPIDGQQMTALVRAQLAIDPNAQFVVKGDGDVNYKSVIDLMVLLQSAGVPSIGLMTEPEEE
ncbi:Cell division and transport-associated protein TolR [Psychromonas ingrahamii 37]|uniref:Tol-Pal system protein TolR n=1 Tax=Psychromonas ingrahamii (strain DSM 17664 / CCUG 51855 / 37) TaxID=357804 RepID=A1SSW2_PSYIN|nr:protein TolR [Psychromonas ingrahamii]ABM02577.1 Cell division and transport-associated protein TolR [Psychromonas ingrahamii 37]